MDILDGVAIFADIVVNVLVTPDRPGMRHKQYFSLTAPHIERFIQVIGPFTGIARFSAAQGVEVMQRMGGIFCGT